MGAARMRRVERSTCFVLIFFCALALASNALFAASPYEATSSRSARDEAIRSIPFDQLTQETAASLSSVVNKPSIYRRMPLEVINSDPDMYLFLVRYPEVVVNIWRVMGITQCTTKRTGPYSLVGSDGLGTDCSVELVYGTPDMHIIYAEGTYQGGLFKRKVKGRCVIVLRSGFSRDNDNRTLVSNQLDMFLQIDNVGLDILAKTLNPLVIKTADYNFVQSAQFLGRISDLSETNGPGVQRLSSKLTEVDPAVSARFSDLAGIVYQRAAIRGGTNLGYAPAQRGLAQESAVRPASNQAD